MIIKEEIENSMSDLRRKIALKKLEKIKKSRNALNLKSDKLVLEADPPPAPEPSAPPPTTPGADATAAPEGQGSPPTDDAGAVPGDLGGAGDLGAPGGATPDLEGGAEGDDPGADMGGGGGGGFGGFGGGGGGGGGMGDEGGEGGAGGGDTEGAASEAPKDQTQSEGDPIQNMVNDVLELSKETQDPSLLFKSIKGQIQSTFAEPTHALGLVKALVDTNNTILKSVAQRLYLYIKTAEPK